MRLLKLGFCRFLLRILILGLSFSLFGVGVAKAELTKVRVGVIPYTPYMLWPAAHEFGIDKEFGLDFQVTRFTMSLPGVQAMIHGDLDITTSCQAEHIAVINKMPHVKDFSALSLFKGFIYVGRKGEWKSFDELVEEMGFEAARETRLKQFKGKKWVFMLLRKPLVADTIAQVGLTLEDIEVMNFADDQKAAVAFIAGVGDVFCSGLPQVIRMLKMGDQFVNLGGHEILGPAGLWYDTVLTTEKFIKENRETCLRAIAAILRTIRLFDEQPEKVARIGAKILGEMTGGEFAVEEFITMQTVYDDFLSIEELLEGYYNPYSRFHWKRPADYFIKLTFEEGDLDKIVPAEEYYGQAEELFWELLKRKDLLQLIYAPFPSEKS